MIGTTRSRVSFFMNRFRQHGFIEYNGRIRVKKSLLNVILHDQSPGQNSTSAPVETGPGKSEKALRRAAVVGVKVRHHDGLKRLSGDTGVRVQSRVPEMTNRWCRRLGRASTNSPRALSTIWLKHDYRFVFAFEQNRTDFVSR